MTDAEVQQLDEATMPPEETYRRLLVLADFLEKLEEGKFYYGTWATGEDLHRCGTTACALGWTAAIPEFRELGVRLRRDHQHLDGGFTVGWASAPFGLTWGSDRTACALFGLSMNEASFLFYPGNRMWDDARRLCLAVNDGSRKAPTMRNLRAPNDDATANEVAQHIREFVAFRQGLRPSWKWVSYGY